MIRQVRAEGPMITTTTTVPYAFEEFPGAGLDDWLSYWTWPCFRGVQPKLAVMIGTLDLVNSSFCICSMGTWIVLPHAVPPGRAVNGRSANRRPSLVSRRTS
jgi:hypothetical protein